MTQKTPREALDSVTMQPIRMTGTWKLGTVTKEAILTALAPYLRTPGTVEVCEDCKVDENYFMDFGCKHCLGDHCPIKTWKQVTK